MKVMVVEDEQASRKLACVVLSAEGHIVFPVSNAEAALESIKANGPDVLLLDLALPGMNGLDLARLLKQDEATQGLAIVAVSAFPEKYGRREALKAGCDAYISKPVNTRTLGKQLSGILAGHSSPDWSAEED